MTPDTLAAAGLRLEVAGPVATITLDRPEVRNAQTPTMWRALAEVGDSLGDEIRVVVLRGAGESFSAGLDRKLLDRSAAAGGTEESVTDLFRADEQTVVDTVDDYQRGFTFLRDPRWISIAVVQGYAIGAGFQLALACDLRLLAEDAQLCMKETALGLVPDLTGTQPLVASVGYARALEICATARMIGAAEAVGLGLALTAVPAAALDAAVHDLVGALTAPMAGAVRETKALLQGAEHRTLDEQRLLERQAQARRFRELAAQLST